MYLIKAVIVLWAIVLQQAIAAQIVVTTVAQDSAPKYLIDRHGQLGGLCPDIARAITSVDPELEIKMIPEFVPFRRIQALLKVGEIDLFFGFARSPERAKTFQFAETPLYPMEYVLLHRKEDDVVVDSLEQLEGFEDNSVLTLVGTASAKRLRAHARVDTLEVANSLDNLLDLLILKRGRFAFYHRLGLSYGLVHHPQNDALVMNPVGFDRYHHYLAFSPNTDPAVVARFDKALRTLRENGTLRKIYREYLFQP